MRLDYNIGFDLKKYTESTAVLVKTDLTKTVQMQEKLSSSELVWDRENKLAV